MPNTVLAAVPRSRVSTVLTAFHRNGYGHVVRILDPERAPITDQLTRAGVRASRLGTATPVDYVLLFVHAPERTIAASSLAVANGATDVEVVACGEPVTVIAPAVMIEQADMRRERRIASRTRRIAERNPAQAAD